MSCWCDEDYYEHLMSRYDKRGFHKYNNLHRNGSYYGYDGYDKHGLDSRCFCKNGFYFMQKGELYDPEGYDKDGYDKDGYDKDGYDKDGYDKDGYDKDGYDK